MTRNTMMIWQNSSGWKINVVLLTATLAACNGGNNPAPTVDTTPPAAAASPTTATLGGTSPIVIRFNESMAVGTLQLSGTLVAGSDGGVWSTTNVANDTLTVSPRGGGRWTAGAGQTLTVNVQDLAGNALPTFNTTYLVPLVFDNFQAAEVVIGQAGFTSRMANQGGTAVANTMNNPFGNPSVAPDGKLYLADVNNHRILGFNSVPTVNNANADLVFGQPNFTSTTTGTSRDKHQSPNHVLIADGKMFVVEDGNSRVVIYNAIPTSSTDQPDVVVGQPDFTSNATACNASTLNKPETLAVTPDGKMIVADYMNERILIWNRVPTTNGRPADVVIGQADFTHCTRNDDNQNAVADANPTARTLYRPSGLWTDGTKLVVNDSMNNRVLIWNAIPTTNFRPADLVLGQGSFTRATRNDDNQDGVADATATARTVNTPSGGVTSNGTQLAIADVENHRVLLWNTFPTTSFQPADVVLGQSNFSNIARNDDNQDGVPETTPTARTFLRPAGLQFHRNQLLVADYVNHRMLVFRSR